jgi:hypothetical protein
MAKINLKLKIKIMLRLMKFIADISRLNVSKIKTMMPISSTLD